MGVHVCGFVLTLLSRVVYPDAVLLWVVVCVTFSACWRSLSRTCSIAFAEYGNELVDPHIPCPRPGESLVGTYLDSIPTHRITTDRGALQDARARAERGVGDAVSLRAPDASDHGAGEEAPQVRLLPAELPSKVRTCSTQR